MATIARSGGCWKSRLAGPPLQGVELADEGAAAPELDRASALLLVEDSVYRGSRCPSELGEHLLRERNPLLRVLGGIEVRQLNEAAKHTPLYGDVEGLEQKLVLPPYFNGCRAALAELLSR